MEGPRTPNQQEKIPEIEKAETELKAEIEGLNNTLGQTEQLSEGAVSEEKRSLVSDKFQQASDAASEKIQKLQESNKHIDKVALSAFCGLLATGVSLAMIGAPSFDSSDTMFDATMYTAGAAYVGVPALWAVARGVNAVRSKFDSWKSNSLQEKS